MQFKKTTTISISPSIKPVFESFDSLRPKDTSFSLFLAMAVEEYVKSTIYRLSDYKFAY